MKRPLIIFVVGATTMLPGCTPNRVAKKQVEDSTSAEQEEKARSQFENYQTIVLRKRRG